MSPLIMINNLYLQSLIPLLHQNHDVFLKLQPDKNKISTK